MIESELSHCITNSWLRALEGGGMSSSSFAKSAIVDVRDVHGMLIVLRLVNCRFGDWLLTGVSFWFPLLRRAKSLSLKIN